MTRKPKARNRKAPGIQATPDPGGYDLRSDLREHRGDKVTISRLPEITIRCRYGHAFRTRAHGNQTVGCPKCRERGKRVTVWIPKDRPRTERAARGPAPVFATGPDPELTGRWERELPWTGQLAMLGGRDGDECPECEGPLLWEPGRTVTYCAVCQLAELPEAVAGHYERAAERSEAVAVRSASAAGSDEDSKALAVRKARLQSDLAGLASADLTPEARGLLDWYADQVTRAGSQARLDDLIGQFSADRDAGKIRGRRWWQGPSAVVLGAADDDYDDEPPEGDGWPAGDDQPGDRPRLMLVPGQSGAGLSTPASLAEQQWRALALLSEAERQQAMIPARQEKPPERPAPGRLQLLVEALAK